jgi:DNA-binding MarR family transcriptional regulator
MSVSVDSVAPAELNKMPLGEYVRLYVALSSIDRIRILLALYRDVTCEQPVSSEELRKTLGMATQRLKHGLKVLREAGLVEKPRSRDGLLYWRLTPTTADIVRQLKSKKGRDKNGSAG